MNLANADLRAYTAPLMADGVLQVGMLNLRRRDRRMINAALSATDALIPQAIVTTTKQAAEVVFRLASARRLARAGAPGALGLAWQRSGRWEALALPVFTRRLQRLIWWHELGHVMGLEHPSDQSLNSDQTVMSYRLGLLPPRWRRADRDAITGLWATPLTETP